MLHQSNITKTDKIIDATYKIIVEDNANTLFIAKEIVYFLKKASGLTLKIVKDTKDIQKGGKYISIGKTYLSKTYGISFENSILGFNGFIIKTIGDHIFMGGYGSFGNIFSGYEFLGKTINFESFNQNVITYTTLKEIPLYNFDVMERPDFEWRYYDTEFRTNLKACRALRFNIWDDLWMGGWHSFFKYIPKNEHLNNADEQKNHPKWYSHNQRQLCLHAHGDEKEKELLVDLIIEKFKAEIKQFPERTLIGFTQEDAWDIPEPERWCRCPKCTESLNKYGSNAAVMIQFCNILGEKLEHWIKTNDEGVPHDRQVRICFFAYTATKDAPVKEGVPGEWLPVDESVVCRNNVSVFYAPIEADWTKSFYDAKNAAAALQTDKWRVLSEKLYVWIYQTNFSYYLYPYNSYDSVKDTYLFFRDRQALFMYNEGQFNQSRGTGFNDLKLYLDSQLLWNVDLDTEKLKEHYFNMVYGDAAGIMRKYFNEVVAKLSDISTEKAVREQIYFTIADKQWWDKDTLKKWVGYTKQAIELIKPLWRTDRKAYRRIKDSIWQESIFPRYALLTLYSDEYNEEELKMQRRKFYEDTVKLNVDWLNEPTRMKVGLADWK